ncbi:hypothetical protein ONE63_010560 [Megalurothrips usitatus]|uniref:TWiK family of potassium channels protein 7 n=1 Tax=Megalurothrips usitatus TaxID=439358 RepID=A0AAV7XHC8_9NEOP|nr:hypothetical protein ONE63_010560 [Megalurothrips usitatus]
MAGAGRSPRGSRGPLHRSRSFDPDPDLRAAIDMGMFGGLGPGGGGGGGGAPMPPGYGHGHYGGFGPPGAGPAMAAAPRPGYLAGYPPGYGPAYPYQHHQQLVHRPNLHGPDLEAERAPSKCGMFWRYVWKLSSCLCSHITLVSLVVAYCLLGALTFEKLESSNEVMVKTNISYRRSNVTQWLWMMTSDTDVLRQDNWTLEAIERLKIFEQELLWAMRSQGWDGIEDASKLQWTFLGALFYSIIVITTIGEPAGESCSLGGARPQSNACLG